MRITLDLPDFTLDDTDPNDPHFNPGLCAGCGNERWGRMARLHGTGWLHTQTDDDTEPTCRQKALDNLQTNPLSAWQTIALHIAKYPSRHDAATIRAVLRHLTNTSQTPN
ncbi:hypothetical protein [Streptomyces sp. NBC_00233]|uniref:hypothetical protein n=1 Tax=Streptomyces sp. NBC_00233 TaxID=2975686 RepID=UPI00224D2A40|nr:hypothetical protein [Streptomyces sp. NBC_00233]MCX5229709.1 hypothetical protein [Streptomyces sp. NBC_00233]